MLPARALSRKVDVRPVPNQRPQQVLDQLSEQLDTNGFDDIQIEYLGGEFPARTDPDDPFVQLVVQSAEPVDGREMQIPPDGRFRTELSICTCMNRPVATAGPGYPGSKTHAPNENVRLDLYVKHAKHIAEF